MYAILLLQQAAQATNAAQQIPVPEKEPALLSMVYMGGLALMLLLLLISLVRNMRRRSSFAAIAPKDLPDEVRRKLGSTATNRGLRALRVLFVLMALTVFGLHVYWAKYAAAENERFQEARYRDMRNRRLSESTLRGWILDRTGRLDRALAYYKKNGNQIERMYPMDKEMAHLFGSDLGDPGLERALFGIQSSVVPEALEVVQGKRVTQDAVQDVKLTIDRDFQKAVAEELAKSGRNGAIVAINPQTGAVLALYSNPSFSLKEVQDEATWARLNADKRENPLLSRALNAYYVPGSTFKTFTMIAGYIAGQQGHTYTATGGGYVAEPGARPITDDNGSCEACGTIGMLQAYQHSSNQYFANLAVALGPANLKKAGDLMGLGTYNGTSGEGQGRPEPELWNASTNAIKRAIAPTQSWLVTNPKMRRYDTALEGFGQGYAGQQTPFQMALFAATIANMEGRLMKPKIEEDRPPEVYNQVVSPQFAAEMRKIMQSVNEGGTGTRALAPAKAAGINTGGKTGTAQKNIPEYDPKTGAPRTRIVQQKDPKTGAVIRQYEELIIAEQPRIDAWYLCVAPIENPQLVLAVVVEGRIGETGVYGGKYAAPIAAQLVLRAKALGLLGGSPANGSQSMQAENRRRQ
ncbi:MAG TPA: penicillin-binding transpeptidase domain-containing protein [Pyrinomonadaceae bacterium]|nr:penicillin-binding transpeptidase domain-containing protein [Pyrinomonadaceae bacterium]